jgi:AhpC/TSA family
MAHKQQCHSGRLCFAIANRTRESWAPKILAEAAAMHPQQVARGQAVYALGLYHRNRARPNDKELPEAEEAKWLAEATRNFTEVTKTYSDVLAPDGRAKLGDMANSQLARIKNLPFLRVGKMAPEIAGEDIDGKPFKLSDYRGKIVLLDFWGHW